MATNNSSQFVKEFVGIRGFSDMKTEELRKKDEKELQKAVLDLKKKLSDVRFKRSSNQLKDVSEIGNTKKEIARLLTVINEKKHV